MDKSITHKTNAINSPWFKPWAIDGTMHNPNRFNGLKTWLNNPNKSEAIKMDKSIQYISNANYSPRINLWAMMAKMDKSIHDILNTIYSPRFKPWAMKKAVHKPNHFNGLKT
jgi:hypothetical protein